MHKFIGQLAGIDVKAERIMLKVKATSDQLGKVIHLAAYTGAGTPRALLLRVVAKDKAGLVQRAQMWKLQVDHEGFARIEFALAHGFDVTLLTRMMGEENVVIAFSDEEGSQS